MSKPRDHLKDAPDPAPWKPAPYEPADHAAVKAVAHGTATEDQQRRAMAYIVKTLAGTYDLSFRPGSERDTAFAEGKRFVGLQLVKFTNAPLTRPGQPTEQAK